MQDTVSAALLGPIIDEEMQACSPWQLTKHGYSSLLQLMMESLQPSMPPHVIVQLPIVFFGQPQSPGSSQNAVAARPPPGEATVGTPTSFLEGRSSKPGRIGSTGGPCPCCVGAFGLPMGRGGIVGCGAFVVGGR